MLFGAHGATGLSNMGFEGLMPKKQKPRCSVCVQDPARSSISVIPPPRFTSSHRSCLVSYCSRGTQSTRASFPLFVLFEDKSWRKLHFKIKACHGWDNANEKKINLKTAPTLSADNSGVRIGDLPSKTARSKCLDMRVIRRKETILQTKNVVLLCNTTNSS